LYKDLGLRLLGGFALVMADIKLFHLAAKESRFFEFKDKYGKKGRLME